MNHKRRRPKHQRAGCLFCKPWKDERTGSNPNPPSVQRRLQDSLDMDAILNAQGETEEDDFDYD